MSQRANRPGLVHKEHWRPLVLGLLRSAAAAVVLVALYYLLPLDHIRNVTATLVVGLLILVAVTAWQLRAVIMSRAPGVRAMEALATTLPLFLLLFALAYHTMSNADPGTFTGPAMTRTDALYFTVTVFATVGFGDITAVSQTARLVVTAQMLLDLLALGLVVRAFFEAVHLGKQQPGSASGPGDPPEQTPRRGVASP